MARWAFCIAVLFAFCSPLRAQPQNYNVLAVAIVWTRPIEDRVILAPMATFSVTYPVGDGTLAPPTIYKANASGVVSMTLVPGVNYFMTGTWTSPEGVLYKANSQTFVPPITPSKLPWKVNFVNPKGP